MVVDLVTVRDSLRIFGFRGVLRNRSGSPPLVERFVAMGRDVLCVAEQLKAPVVGLDPVDCSVEVYSLAVGGEDVGPEVVCNARLCFSLDPCPRFSVG